MPRIPYAPPPPTHIPSSKAKTAMVILWPAFLAAAALNALFFSMFDPSDLVMHGVPVDIDKLAAYGIGFGVCFLFATISSFMTWSLTKPPESQPIERRSPYSL
ncbi:MAG: hypothetical protein RJA58_1509 [Pseudomonadota bacterium]